MKNKEYQWIDPVTKKEIPRPIEDKVKEAIKMDKILGIVRPSKKLF